MPREKRRRARTGRVRRRRLREEQEQYRHSHGLNTHDVAMRHCFHAQMTSADLATITLCTNILTFDCFRLWWINNYNLRLCERKGRD